MLHKRAKVGYLCSTNITLRSALDKRIETNRYALGNNVKKKSIPCVKFIRNEQMLPIVPIKFERWKGVYKEFIVRIPEFAQMTHQK